MRPQAVDRGAPADLGAAPPQPAPQCAQAPLGHVAQLHRRRLEIGVRTGDQATPRQRDDPAPVARRIERQHHVDHRQAGADQQRGRANRGELRDRGMGIRAPRVADEAAADAGERAQRFGLLIADSKRQSVGVDPLAAIEHDLPAAIAAGRAARGRIHWPGLAAGYRLVEDFAEIAAEQPALGKSAGIAAFRLEQAREMVGLAGPGAHSFGAYVEQMRRLAVE